MRFWQMTQPRCCQPCQSQFNRQTWLLSHHPSQCAPPKPACQKRMTLKPKTCLMSICSPFLKKRRLNSCRNSVPPCASGARSRARQRRGSKRCGCCTRSKAAPAWLAPCVWAKWRTAWSLPWRPLTPLSQTLQRLTVCWAGWTTSPRCSRLCAPCLSKPWCCLSAPRCWQTLLKILWLRR